MRRGGEKRRYSFPSDIYSFGMLLLELSLGRVPTQGLPFQLMVLTKLHEDGFGLQELEARASASQVRPAPPPVLPGVP